MQTCFIDFRGAEYEVEYRYENDKECGLDGVYEWSFSSPDAPEPTAEEEAAIADLLTRRAREDMPAWWED